MVAPLLHAAKTIPAPRLALLNQGCEHLRDQRFVESLPNRGFVFGSTKDAQACEVLTGWIVTRDADTLPHARTLTE